MAQLKVKDLLEQLAKADPEAPVWLGSFPCDSVTVKKGDVWIESEELANVLKNPGVPGEY